MLRGGVVMCSDPCSMSDCLQDEKNEMLHTNLWLEYVSVDNIIL